MTKGVSKEQLDRINELAHKKKTVGLTAAELAEQKELYKIFLEDFRARLKQQLDCIEIVEPDDTRLKKARFKGLKEYDN